jgi:hypothetical protein
MCQGSIISPLHRSMCSIRISPEVPIYISADKTLLRKTKPTTQSRIVRERLFVLPVGKDNDYLVCVDGFPHAPGGIVETERLTTGHTIDDITLTTTDDAELSRELGVTAVKIDGILYEAVNPTESG